jgi:allantoate deiminase
MPVNADRIRHDITMLAGFTETPGAGSTRPTFSKAWRDARDYVAAELEKCGCNIRIDAFGNLHARHRAISWESPVWMSGSHLDTVPHGGSFDGVVGVVAALEAMRAADKKVVPLEVVIWAEEEGTTFGLGMIGSRAFVGELIGGKLAELRNGAGQSWFEAGAEHGVNREKLEADRLKTRLAVGFIEVHVEQGPGLWNEGHPVACVTAISGRRQYQCTLTGASNHAGSTLMIDRRDALAGAAQVITAIEDYSRHIGGHTVGTVGQIICEPNAINVIPGRVSFTIDFRSESPETLARADHHIRRTIEEIANSRTLEHTIAQTEGILVTEMSHNVCGRIRKAAIKRGFGEITSTASGALHDAAILAPHIPTAMIFVASRDGISHNPDEFSRIEDIAAATNVLAECVRDRTID